MTTYYVTKNAHGIYTLRQTRYKVLFEAGKEHRHDVMADGFTAEGMREIIAKYFQDTDTTALAKE